MKINPIQKQNAIQNYKTSRMMQPKQDAAPGKMDEVTFSEDAVSFSKILTEVKNQLEAKVEERPVRLDEIANKVRSGEYKVDSDKVADKIVRDILLNKED